ncbi:MAG: hypothetical protein GY869_12360 [Planctomycetes bacterium]|nr:hypothetical protein [Planctomycetota bacterium]
MNLPRLHTNFRINAAGETLVLSRPDGIVIDSLSTGAISADISKGRQPDGEINWLFFTQPTPGTSNDSPGYAGILEQPQFSHPGGLHPNPFELSITSTSETAQTRYSLDGSLPVETSAIYSGPIYIGQTTVVRAGTFEAGFLPSKIVTHTYLIDLDTELPIVSVSTDPGNFFDSDIGIYVDEHIWEDWERAIHLEFFEPGNELGFSIDAGAKIYGGWTRTLPQKSLAVFARGIYGCPEINYRIFPAKQIDRFEAIVLRNSGNDWLGSEMWGGTMLRDGLMTGLVTDSGVDIQAFRPAIVFINGEYWGIHNIREKINEHFIASNHGVDPGDIDLLEFNGSVILGDNLHYFALIDFVSSNDLSDSDNYAYVESQLEIDNFIDYNIFQIYFANTDWPGNNIKFWRPRTENGKWRWILYDTDFGFGLVENYAHNTLLFALDDNGPEWPNPPWSTLLLRRLMENETFRNRFANRYCYYASTIFDSDNVLAQLNHFTQNISQEIPEHTIRWGWNMSSWNQNVNAVSIFGLNRPSYVRHHVRTYFGLNEVSILTLTISPENSGVVEISGLPAAEFPWLGQYFDDLPIEIEAIPGPGFQFSHWLQSGQQEPSISVTLEADLELNAVFIPYSGGQNIVINEINYNSAPDFNPGDWVELYNNTNATIDLSGWVFKDSEDAHNFTFPANLALVAEEYLVLCRDAAAFSASFPGIGNYLGDFDFGLSGNGESIRLSDSAGNIIDSLAYDDNLPWPTEPDGSGSTLALIDPNFDNALPESWAASLVFGTPGMVNDVTDIVADENEFSLNQNYPNPFNPTTTIQFSLQNPRFERNRVEVTLSIYSISGRLVKRLLANERFDPGLHSVQWDGTDKTGQVVNSGVYLYRLQAKSSDQKEISQIRRMILLK